MTGVVVDVVQRTSDTATLYIFVGDNERDYKAGQFVSIKPQQFPELARFVQFLEYKKGRKEGIRSYSLSSIPAEKTISITVKSEGFDPQHDLYPPLLSPLLASGALKGREIELTGYTGSYVLAEDHHEKTTQVLHMVAGSGIVPNYALVKEALSRPEWAGVKHTMLYTNRTYDDIIFRDQLEALAKAHPERFELFHLLTREENPARFGPNYLKGRPSFDVVSGFVDDASTVLVYACGAAITKWQKKKAQETGIQPNPRFMEAVEDIVHKLGVDKARFKKEEFG